MCCYLDFCFPSHSSGSIVDNLSFYNLADRNSRSSPNILHIAIFYGKWEKVNLGLERTVKNAQDFLWTFKSLGVKNMIDYFKMMLFTTCM